MKLVELEACKYKMHIAAGRAGKDVINVTTIGNLMINNGKYVAVEN